MNILQILRNPEKRLNQLYRNEKIGKSLKKFNDIKRAEKGFHRVKLTIMGVPQDYLLLADK